MERLDPNNYDHAGFRIHRRHLFDYAVYYYGHPMVDHLRTLKQARRAAERLACSVSKGGQP